MEPRPTNGSTHLFSRMKRGHNRNPKASELKEYLTQGFLNCHLIPTKPSIPLLFMDQASRALNSLQHQNEGWQAILMSVYHCQFFLNFRDNPECEKDGVGCQQQQNKKQNWGNTTLESLPLYTGKIYGLFKCRVPWIQNRIEATAWSFNKKGNIEETSNSIPNYLLWKNQNTGNTPSLQAYVLQIWKSFRNIRKMYCK